MAPWIKSTGCRSSPAAAPSDWHPRRGARRPAAPSTTRLFTAAKVGVDGSQAFGYDVAADGRRFVVVRTITRPERHAVVVENWLARWGRESKVALAHAVLRRGSALMAQDQALQRLAARLGSKGRAMRPAVAHAGGVANQLVVDGRLVGTWARRFHARTAVIEVRTSRPLTRAEKHALFVECERYGRFVDMPVRLSVA